MSDQRHRVASSTEVIANGLFACKVDGTKLLLSRVDGTVRAVVDRCPHFGMSMAKGGADGNVVTCPWHGSRFDLVTGENLDWITGFMGKDMPQWTCKLLSMGKQPEPLKTVSAEEQDGEVFVVLGG